MSVRKLRSDAGTKRKPELTQREAAIRWYAALIATERERFRDDLTLVDWIQRK